MKAAVFHGICASAALIGLAACGGGGSDSGPTIPGPTPPASTYSIGGTVSGLAGNGLVLQNNGANDFSVAGNGSFTFSTALASGASYNVTVLTKPINPIQQCTVANGSGTVGTAAITNVAVTCTTVTARFAYAANYYGGTISIYNVDSSTGQLRMRGYVKAGNSPVYGVGDKAGKFSYVLNRGTAQSPPSLPPIAATVSSISAYAHDNVTGDLKPITPSPLPLTSTVAAANLMSIHPSDKFIYVTNDAGVNSISAFAVNGTTGALTAIGNPVAAGAAPTAVVFDAAGKFAYVTNYDSNDIYVYSVDGTTGALTEMPALRTATGQNPSVLALHSSGKFAYVVNTAPGAASGSVSAYAVNATTGALTALAGSPYTIGTNPANEAAIFHPGGKFVYVRNIGASGAAGSISAFAIDATTGVLTSIPGSPYPIGVASSGYGGSGMDPAGKYFYVANRGTGVGLSSVGSISAFSIDASIGALTPLAGLPTVQPAPYTVSVDPSGKYVYEASIESDQIRTYSINASTGALTLLDRGGVIRSGAQPIAVPAYVSSSAPAAAVFTPKFAYLPNAGGNTISAYTTDATTGALASVGVTIAGGTSPQAVASSQGSKFLYSAHLFSNDASAYGINATTGALSLLNGGTQAAGASPAAIAADPSGRFVYVANLNSNDISMYAVNASTGALVNNGTMPVVVTNPLALAVDPTGRNLYVMSTTFIQVLQINGATGALASPPVVFGPALNVFIAAGGTQLAVDPRAKYLYVANVGGGGSIEFYAIDTYSGVLVSTGRLITNRPNISIAIEPGGRFAYTADSTVNSVSAFAINQSNGALTQIGSPVATTADVQFVNVDYSGKFLYAVLANRSVASYSISPATGALTLISGGGASTGVSPGPITTVGEVE